MLYVCDAGNMGGVCLRLSTLHPIAKLDYSYMPIDSLVGSRC